MWHYPWVGIGNKWSQIKKPALYLYPVPFIIHYRVCLFSPQESPSSDESKHTGLSMLRNPTIPTSSLFCLRHPLPPSLLQWMFSGLLHTQQGEHTQWPRSHWSEELYVRVPMTLDASCPQGSPGGTIVPVPDLSVLGKGFTTHIKTLHPRSVIHTAEVPSLLSSMCSGPP